MELRSLPDIAKARERPPDALTSSSPTVVDVKLRRGHPRAGLRRLADDGITCVVDAVHVLAGLTVEPVVADDAVLGRICPSHEHRMPRAGERIGGLVVSVGEVDAAIHQQAETFRAKAIVEAWQKIAAQLIHCDLQNQLRRRHRLSRIRRRAEYQAQNERSPGRSNHRRNPQSSFVEIACRAGISRHVDAMNPPSFSR